MKSRSIPARILTAIVRFPKAKPLIFFGGLVSVAALTLVCIVVLFYATQFRGGLSDRQEVWGAFGDYLGGILSVAFSSVSLMFALYVLLKTNQDKRLDQIYKFLDDFKSDKMSGNLKLLWDFYLYKDFSHCTKPFSGDASRKTAILMKRYVAEQRKKSAVYLARRSVSYFYLYLAIFLKNNPMDEKSILAVWPASSLSTLETIIMPCERAITAKEVTPNKFPYFRYLIKKWEEFEPGRF